MYGNRLKDSLVIKHLRSDKNRVSDAARTAHVVKSWTFLPDMDATIRPSK